MSVMATTDLPVNGLGRTRSTLEALSSGRCPMDEQRGPGRHPASVPSFYDHLYFANHKEAMTVASNSKLFALSQKDSSP